MKASESVFFQWKYDCQKMDLADPSFWELFNARLALLDELQRIEKRDQELLEKQRLLSEAKRMGLV